MREMFRWVVLLLLCLLHWAGRAASEPLVVAATVYPPATWMYALAGGRSDVLVLVPAGANPHTFEPVPSQVRRLRAARLLVQIGAGLDTWAAALAKATDHPLDTLVLADRVPLLPWHEGEGYDPHFWLDPVFVRDAVVPVLVEQLCRIDPPRSTAYKQRAVQWQAELSELDERVRHILAPVKGRAYVAVHSAWRYFARRYGLVEAATIEPVPGRELSAREMVRLVEAVRQSAARAVIIEPYAFSRPAQQIATETQLRLVCIDPFGSGPLADGYARLLEANAQAFKEALQ